MLRYQQLLCGNLFGHCAATTVAAAAATWMYRLQQCFWQFQCSRQWAVAITRLNWFGTILSLFSENKNQKLIFQIDFWKATQNPFFSSSSSLLCFVTKLTYVNNSNVLAAGKIFFDDRLRLLPFGAIDVVITELVPLPFVMIFNLFEPLIGWSLWELLLLFIATVTSATDAVSD